MVQGTRFQVSFRDKLVGTKTTHVVGSDADLLDVGLFRIEHDGGNRLLPRCYVKEELF